MAGTVNRKRSPKVRKGQRLRENAEQYVVNARGKRVAVVLDLDEYQRLIAGNGIIERAQISADERAKLVKLARQAKGSWKESEGEGTAVEIVRRLRDEWNR